MDAIELGRAKEWIEEYGYWRPGAPELRPAQLRYSNDAVNREFRMRDAVSRAIGRMEQYAKDRKLRLPDAFRAKTATTLVGEGGAFCHVD